ncbi:MAG: DUF3786 domain-containing protein [Dehalococcoidales bacterium]|nr:MAG: DUF3786 domain-containing protein [Dehalococcoidales bacterium]
MPAEKDRSVYNLDVAYAIVRERLTSLDVEEQCRHSGSEYRKQDAGATATVYYLNQPYLVTFPEVKVTPTNGTDLPLREQILILHYLSLAKGTAATNNLITFRDLPGGIVYYPTFSKRTMEPLTRYFGREPELLVKAAERLGAHQADIGDTTVVINAFRHVPITMVLWHGDEELSPQLNLLFDANILDYLETEDITVVCEIVTWKLVSYSRET